MAIYAEVRQITALWGVVTAVVDMGSHVPEAKPPEVWMNLTGYTPAPVAGEAWWYDFQGDVFTNVDPGLTEPARTVTPSQFWFGKVTNDERGKIFTLAQEDGGGVVLDMIQRGRLKALLAFTTANSFKLDNAELVFIFNALESVGAIDPGRAAEILS